MLSELIKEKRVRKLEDFKSNVRSLIKTSIIYFDDNKVVDIFKTNQIDNLGLDQFKKELEGEGFSVTYEHRKIGLSIIIVRW